MNPHPIRPRRRDAPFILLVLLTLGAIAMYLGQGVSGGNDTGRAWRRIDTQAVQRLLDAGELSAHEAVWYHETRPDELVQARAGR